MAVDNIHTLGRLNLAIIEALIDTHCTVKRGEWRGCFETDGEGRGVFNLNTADTCFERNGLPQELLTRLRIIHELGNNSGREFVERMADKEAFTGAAGAQVDGVVSAVEELVGRYPDAAKYTSGAIL